MQTKYIPEIKRWVLANKAITVLIAAAFLSATYGSFRSTSASTDVRYILGKAQVGTAAASVSGTGSVSAESQIDLKAKTSGDILSVKVKPGDTVYEGQIIASLDATDASITLRDAEIAYEKLAKPADSSALSSAQSAFVSAQTSETKAYNDAETDASSMFLDVPSILDSLNSLFNSPNGYMYDSAVRYISDTAISYRNTSASDLYLTQTEFTALSNEYRGINRTSSTSTVETLISHAYTVSKDLAQTLKEAKTAVDYVKANTPPEIAAAGVTAQTNIATWTDKNSAHLSALLDDQNALTTTHLSVIDKQAALDKVNAGSDSLDLESASLNLEEKRNAYNNSFIYAPFSGVVGRVNAKAGDSASLGTIIATLITTDEIAEISLNEVDAAKVKEGDKAKLTFDAVDGLTINGTVSEIDLVGTVTQGVVTYNAKIAFDTQDPRIHSGMSVSATITTESKSGIVVVPSSAVKTIRGSSYVQVFDPALPVSGSQPVTSSVPPQEKKVVTGITGDTTTEVVSGLDEGEQIVVRAITSGTAQTTTTQSGGLFGAGRGTTGTGGATRALGR
jgi:membrane fusion protein, macrolide-specific efflux system